MEGCSDFGTRMFSVLKMQECSNMMEGYHRDMLTFSSRSQNSEGYSTDSGMEDGSVSPVSSIGSEPQEFPRNLSMTDAEPEVPKMIYPVKPKVLTPSESSAFNKIDKWTPAYPPTFGPIAPMCGTSPMGYLPGFFISPWMSESLSRGYLNPAATGVMYGKPEMTSPTSSAAQRSSDSEENSSPEKQQYFHVDPRIPFTNYFMNLTKMFQKEQELSGKKTTETRIDFETNNNNNNNNTSEKMHKNISECSSSDEESPEKSVPVVKTELTTTVDDESDSNPCHFNNRPNQRNESASYSATNPRMALENPGTSAHGQIFHEPTSFPGLQRLTSFPAPIGHSPSMLPFLGNLPSSSGFFHPAFLQMSGLGNKRTNPDKPAPIKKYKCDVCGKAFSRSNTLVTHKRIHTGDKPFKCEVCGRAFRQPGNLTRHRLTHTTVKPYVCPQCNKAFNRASNLHTHMRTHTNYKPFICPYCGKGFHQKIDMKIHCYTHTGERPHRCDVCGKGFSLASTLTTHKRIHYDTAYPSDHMAGTGSASN